MMYTSDRVEVLDRDANKEGWATSKLKPMESPTRFHSGNTLVKGRGRCVPTQGDRVEVLDRDPNRRAGRCPI
jgi:hypothetical protein